MNLIEKIIKVQIIVLIASTVVYTPFFASVTPTLSMSLVISQVKKRERITPLDDGTISASKKNVPIRFQEKMSISSQDKEAFALEIRHKKIADNFRLFQEVKVLWGDFVPFDYFVDCVEITREQGFDEINRFDWNKE